MRYIPIPKVFHRKYPDFFVEDINEFLYHSGPKRDLPQVWFRLQLPKVVNYLDYLLRIT